MTTCGSGFFVNGHASVFLVRVQVLPQTRNMKLELLMKAIDRDPVDDEEEAERIAKRIIEGEEEVKFTYKPFTIDVRDVGSFGLEDDTHTKIMMPFGIFYAKINYYTFKGIYSASIGCDIKDTKAYKIIKK